MSEEPAFAWPGQIYEMIVCDCRDSDLVVSDWLEEAGYQLAAAIFAGEGEKHNYWRLLVRGIIAAVPTWEPSEGNLRMVQPTVNAYVEEARRIRQRILDIGNPAPDFGAMFRMRMPDMLVRLPELLFVTVPAGSEAAEGITVCTDTRIGDPMIQCECGSYRPAHSSGCGRANPG